MCCGKMVRLPNERERTMLTTRDINVNFDKKGVINDNIKANKRGFKQGEIQASESDHEGC